MQLVFLGPVLNHHQAPVADKLFEMLGDGFKFVELTDCRDLKGAKENYSTRPYLIKVADSGQDKILSLVRNADVCVFAGYDALPYQIERLKLGKLSFDMGERWLKRGILNLLSPRIASMVMAYHLRGWRNKPIYKLCCSAFAAKDCRRLGTYRNRCFKWGYFTEPNQVTEKVLSFDKKTVRIMWCARFLKLKHPELAIEMARNLKNKGYRFHLDIYGDEDPSMPRSMVFPKVELIKQIEDSELNEFVTLCGNRPNDEIIEAMKRSDIFLFTSDRNEGWGAVANESMSCGCVLVASEAIGSIPYLINHGENGLMFRNGDSDSLTEKVEWLLNHKDQMSRMGIAAAESLREIWSPRNAAQSILTLIENIQNGTENNILSGPCSNA